MRIFLIIALTLLLIAGGVVAYLMMTTPRDPVLLQFPLSEHHRQLLELVPASAEMFALVPSAAHLHRTLTANPVTRDAIARWAFEHELPRSWMLGGAEVVVWRRGGVTSYAVRLDRGRAWILRTWLAVASHAEVRWDGTTLMMNAGTESASPASLEGILALTEGLPEGDALIVQREGERGAFPPIGRPAVTSARVTESGLTTVSRSPDPALHEGAVLQGQFPRGALLAVTFSDPPRVLSDLHRIIGTRIDDLIGKGGSVVLYEVDSGTFLPRPRGVIAVPADAERREAMRQIAGIADLIGETSETDDELIVSFGRGSVERYHADERDPARWSASRWAVRLDPQRLAPVLRKAGDSTGLRIAAPRLHRGARDLRRWLSTLERAESIEAASSNGQGFEELRVHVAARTK
ncbi:MAG TPA: hypothetical protein VF701_15395 [Thermoanaerobaculia bacterium]